MTAPEADYDTDAPGVCWECDGPCLTHKGSVHGWRCSACLERYLDAAAARWAAKSDKAKERVERGHQNASVTATDRRLEGGQRYVPHPPASAQQEAADPRYVPRRDDHHHQEGLTE
jgi:hypothetical protein